MRDFFFRKKKRSGGTRRACTDDTDIRYVSVIFDGLIVLTMLNMLIK
jgi:hypothetical protein